MQVVSGGVRLVALYEAYGRNASMVFYFRSYENHPPTEAECQAVADAYGLWENYGAGDGYASVRHEDSQYVGVSVRALGGPGSPAFVDRSFRRSGNVSGFRGDMLPTGIAPLCHWWTEERGPKTGRTYLVGISSAITSGVSDLSNVDDSGAAEIGVYCANLRAMVLGVTGYTQCHYTASPRGGVGIGQFLLEITGSWVDSLTASRRLRTRPGR